MSFYFSITIIVILLIGISLSLWELESQNYAFGDTLSSSQSSSSLPSSQLQLRQQQQNQDSQIRLSLSQLNPNDSSNNASLQITPSSSSSSSPISTHSINNTNVTAKAAAFPPGINFSEMIGPFSELRLTLSKLAIDIPMQKGYENGNEIYFVTFDASDQELALNITNSSNDFPVHYTKLLAQTPSKATEQAYIFTNGIKGKGHLGYQPTIVGTKPGDKKQYSPLKHVNLVEWKIPSSARELKSIQELVNAQNIGEIITINTTATSTTNLVINSPAIKWQDGSLKIRQDKVIILSKFIYWRLGNILRYRE